MKNRLLLQGMLAALLSLNGCSEPAAAVDDTPFREAVARYVRTNDMAMKLKEIKEPPTIDGNQAKMAAAMTHAELSGPSVAWRFEFAKQGDGTWQVVRHTD